MRFKQFRERWQGIFLITIGCIGTLWYAASGQLNLYINPSYIIFTTIMTLLGLIACFYSFGRRININEITEDTTNTARTTSRFTGIVSTLIVAMCLLAFIDILVLQPSTLTTSTVAQRGINSGIDAGTAPSNAVPLFVDGNYDSLTIKDWASLLTETNNQSFFTGKTANIIGFITPDTDDPQNVFFVSRFIITCCAIDARPIGVPVYAPGWQQQHKANGWVQVTGAFESDPSSKSQQYIVLKPTKIADIAQPKDPYVR